MKSQLLAVLLVGISISLTAQNDKQKGDMLRDMRDYQSAIASYEKAHADSPADQAVCAEIGRAYVQMQDYLNASKWYEQIADREDVTPEYLLEYGHVLKSLRLYAKAKFYYQKYASSDAETASHFVESCDYARAAMDGTPLYQVNPSVVNTPGMEFAPSKMGDELVFCAFGSRATNNAPRKTKDGNMSLDDNNVTYSIPMSATDMKSVAPIAGDPGIDGMITHVRTSENGKWVAFAQSDFQDGQRLFEDRPGKMSMFIGQVDESGSWINVAPFAYNGNGYSTGYPCFSSDGTVMYFASTRPGGYGGWDLYVSFRGQQGWTQPQNLGPVVNTPGNEIAPCYQDQRMYFASDWHTGLGGFDLFMALSNEGQWNNVTSMGYPLNSSKDDIEICISSDGKSGFFTSNRTGSSGQYDIYSFTGKFEDVELHVMDQDGREPIAGAEIKSRSGKFMPVTTDASGRAVIRQPEGSQGDVVITHEGYRELEMVVNPAVSKGARYEVFIDQSLETNQKPPVADAKPQAPSVDAKQKAMPPAPEPVVTTKTIVVGNPTETSGTISGGEIVQSEASTSPSPEAIPSRPIGKYAVQVAAVNKQTGLEMYKPLEKFGQLMQYPENGMYKIRVGYFATEADASAALRGIRTTGYKDAFIVRANPAESTSTDENVASEPTQTSTDAGYMVRLGTYSKPEYFNAGSVQHLGKVESRKSGVYTIMLLTGYKTPEQAEIAREGAKKAGFADAYIATEEAGVIRKYTGN